MAARRGRRLKFGYGTRVTVAATLGLGLGVGGYAIASTTVGAPSALSAISTSASKSLAPGLPGTDQGSASGMRFFGRRPAALGTVTAVNGVTTASTCGAALTGTETGAFTIKTRGDHTSTTALTDMVEVSATTTFRDPAVGSVSFGNLCVGDMVVVEGTVSSSTVTATNVVILPAGFRGPGGPNMPWGGGGPGESWRSGSGVMSPPASSSSSAIKTA